MLSPLRDLPIGPNKPCDISPLLLLTNLIIPSEPLHRIKNATQIQLLPLKDCLFLQLLPQMFLQEPAVLQLDGLGVARKGPAQEAMNRLRIRREGEALGVEGERRGPGLRRHDSADAKGLRRGPAIVNEL